MITLEAIPHEVRRAGPILVTGAGGFLGANLVWALREHGLVVRALVRRPPAAKQWQGLDGVEFVQGDVRDPAAMAAAVRGAGYVIHGAALTELVPRPRRRAFAVNVEGTRNICDAALRAGVRRLVFISSAATVACGTSTAPATEDSPYNLASIPAPYYASKRQAERLAAVFTRRGLETIILCPTYILGPRDLRPTTNELLLYLSWTRRPIVPPGGMNILDVREAALAHLRALWCGEPGARYLLAGPYRTYAQLGELVQQITGAGRRVQVMPAWTRVPGAGVLALAAGILPRLPGHLAVPSFCYGYVSFHVSGERGDRTFGLRHRPVSTTVFDTLCWFQQTGLAPWLQRSLAAPASDASSTNQLAGHRQ
jgi:dihydroflavonol-4-reductase